MPAQILSQSRLKNLLHYNSKTGIFTWARSRPGAHSGSIAGSLNKKQGYVYIKVFYKRYCAHRLAFLYMTGSMPNQCDHINHIKNDNRWINLRPATNRINQKNLPLSKRNKSGHPGVFWCRDRKKWFTSIRVNRKMINLGRFTQKSDAISARKAANIKYGFHPNHGKRKAS